MSSFSLILNILENQLHFTMEMISPPKPTRIVNCLLPNPVEGKASKGDEDFSEQNSELSLSSREILSLPALAGEVAVAQKQQINDLSKRQEVLDQLKVSVRDCMTVY